MYWQIIKIGGLIDLNVLFVVRGYPSAKYKTNGIFEYDMAKGLAEMGHNVTYLAIDLRSVLRKRHFGFESFQQDKMQIEAINIPMGRIYNPIRTYIATKVLFHRMHDLIRKGLEFDLIHGHFIQSSYFAAKIKEKYKKPLVVTEHSSKLFGDITPYVERKMKYTYAQADLVTTVSTFMQNVLKQRYQLDALLIPNVVDETVFSDVAEWKPKEVFTFVSTGNLIETKGHMNSLAAMKNLRNKKYNVKLVIFGDGPLRGEMEQYIVHEDLGDSVILRGQVSREVLGHAYSDADAFILPSHRETFGVAYVEALYMGIPVIATDCGGPSDYVKEDNGLMVPVNDVGALTRAMEYMIKHRGKYNGKCIAADARKNYSRKSNSNVLENLYGKLMDLNYRGKNSQRKPNKENNGV